MAQWIQLNGPNGPYWEDLETGRTSGTKPRTSEGPLSAVEQRWGAGAELAQTGDAVVLPDGTNLYVDPNTLEQDMVRSTQNSSALWDYGPLFMGALPFAAGALGLGAGAAGATAGAGEALTLGALPGGVGGSVAAGAGAAGGLGAGGLAAGGAAGLAGLGDFGGGADFGSENMFGFEGEDPFGDLFGNASAGGSAFGGLGDLLSGGLGGLGNALGGLVPSGNTALAMAPILAAIAYAKNQGNFDTSRLEDTYNQFDPNTLAFEYDQNTGRQRDALTSSLQQRGVMGSSFGNMDLTNLQTSRDLGRRSLVNQGLAARGGLASSILDAQVKERALKNDLYGRSLLAMGNVFGGRR